MNGKTEAKEISAEQRMSGAHVAVVNRTHRVVRDQATRMREQRRRRRSLWAPLVICSFLLLAVCYAVWGLLAGYDLTPTDIPDASDQMMLFLLLWSVPVAAVVLSLIWVRRGGQQGNFGEPTS